MLEGGEFIYRIMINIVEYFQCFWFRCNYNKSFFMGFSNMKIYGQMYQLKYILVMNVSENKIEEEKLGDGLKFQVVCMRVSFLKK